MMCEDKTTIQSLHNQAPTSLQAVGVSEEHHYMSPVLPGFPHEMYIHSVKYNRNSRTMLSQDGQR